MKVAIFGLDGASFHLIRPWIKNGSLKNFKKLLQEGCHGNLKSTMIPTTWPGWACFSTGKNPGKIGVYDFENLETGSYDRFFVYSPNLPRLKDINPLWTLLENKRSIIINVPGTFPPEKIRGIIISGMFTPKGSNYTYPKGLADEIRKIVGDYRIDLEEFEIGEETFRREIFSITHKRFKIADHLMKKLDNSWDFLFIVFTGPDRVQHKFWKYMDIEHPLYNARLSQRYGNTIKEYWLLLDEKLGALLSNLSADDYVFIVSDHGHGRLTGVFNVNDWLIKEGYLKLKELRIKKEWSLVSDARKILEKKRFLQKIAGFMPKKFRRYMSRCFLGKKSISNMFPSKKIDWRNTKAFAVGTYGKIYINVRSKRPEGSVNPGREYEELIKEITTKLKNLSGKGERLNVKVYRAQDIYKGDFVDNAPDLIPVLNNFELHVGTALQGELFTDLPYSQTHARKYSSAHREDGIFIVNGPYIKRRKEIIGARLVDVAPTILHLMGFPVPKDVDGRVLSEIFTEGSEPARRKVRYLKIAHVEREKIRARIKRLKHSAKI